VSSNNPYAPPGAAVADVLQGGLSYQPVRFWPPNGRIGRLRYIAYAIGVTLLIGVLGGVLGVLSRIVGAGEAGAFIASGLGGLIALVASVVLLIQRSHDMDLSGWTCILAMIPIIGLYWIFKGGTPGANRFGAPPPPNTLLVKIVALALPVIFLIGIVAAIVLPASQRYGG